MAPQRTSMFAVTTCNGTEFYTYTQTKNYQSNKPSLLLWFLLQSLVIQGQKYNTMEGMVQICRSHIGIDIKETLRNVTPGMLLENIGVRYGGQSRQLGLASESLIRSRTSVGISRMQSLICLLFTMIGLVQKAH